MRQQLQRITAADVPADKEAMFVCSFICAGLESLLKREPKKHSRRARMLAEHIERTKGIMDLYPGAVTISMLDLAVELFEQIEATAVRRLREEGQ